MDGSVKHYLKQELRSKKEQKAVFHPQQIYLCMGLLLRYGNQRPPGAVSNELLDSLGKVLLQISGLCEEKPIIHEGSPSHQRREIAGFLWQIANFLTLYNVDLGSELARSHLVYTSGKEGKELSSAFKQATGVDLLTFWSVVFALYAKWHGSLSEFISTNVVLDKTRYFVKCRSLDLQQVDETLSLLSTDISGHRKLCEDRLDAFDHEAFNFEWLREKPLLEFEPGRYICLSLPFLVQRATLGISDLMRTQMGGVYSKEVGNSLGRAHQKYVRSLLEEAYNSKLAQRFLYRKIKGAEITDGLIDYGDKLVCMEVKAGRLEKRYRLSNRYSDLKKGLRHYLIEGAKQLDDRISELRDGRVIIEEIHPGRIKRYYPVLVMCVDPIPQFDILTEEYHCILEDEGILRAKDLAPLTILDIAELEAILELVKGETSLIDLIDRKINSRAREWSYHNYMLTIVNSPPKRPPHLDRELESLFTEMKEELGL